MSKWKRLALVALMVLALGLVGVVVAAPLYEPAAPAADYAVNWQVLANGGQTLSGGSYRMESTIGQPVVGEMSGGGYKLGNGFWYGVDRIVVAIRSLLPFITRP